MVEYSWSWEIYYGNGAETLFPFYFQLAPDSVVKVRVTNAEGAREVDNFRILPGDPDDPDAVGMIEYPYPAAVPLGEDEEITIYRETPMVQTLAIDNQGGFLLENIEAVLDRIVMMAQEVVFHHRHALDGYLAQMLDITNQGALPIEIWDALNEIVFVLSEVLNRPEEPDEAGIGVYVTDANGNTTKIPSGEYRVRPAGQGGYGGYVDYPWPPDAGSPLPEGAEIEIARETTTNALPFPGPDFNPRQLEHAMDRLVMICQEAMGRDRGKARYAQYI